MKTVTVIAHPEWGVFLGAAIGLAFWSKLETAGQDTAVGFPTEHHARAFARTAEWDSFPLTYHSVQETKPGYASMMACVAAGLPGWLNENIQPVGGVQ